ncbi:MAG: aminotransferase class V-fold PLP-dependent enzyme, partial [Thermoguttaceae bacterium]|nr:aminotransferase class V-fold PLP-dependent enzyme [Thermoguttaceae bacterium]
MQIRVYADAAATTRLSQTALEKALPFLRDSFGNPSSQHSAGVAAKRALEEARGMIAEAIGAAADEIVFTSGASEANAWILTTVGRERANAANLAAQEVAAPSCKLGAGRVVTSTLEHSSIRRSCEALKRQGVAVDCLPSNRDGVVSLDALQQILDANAADINLTSITLANNEIGTIQPIAESGALLRRFGVPFHTDATQAVGHIPLDVRALNVDFLTASAHKFNGPKGVGFLYLRRGVSLPSLILGGEQ